MTIFVVAGGVLMAIIAFVLGRRSKDRRGSKPPSHESALGGIHDEHIEEVTEAAEELVGDLSADAAARHRRIMSWLRKRTGR